MKRKEVGITGVKTYSFTLRPETVEGLDKIVKFKGFESRSAFVELILRQHFKELIKDGKKIRESRR